MGSDSGHAGEASVNQLSTLPLSIMTAHGEKLAICSQERACTRNLPCWYLNLRLQSPELCENIILLSHTSCDILLRPSNLTNIDRGHDTIHSLKRN